MNPRIVVPIVLLLGAVLIGGAIAHSEPVAFVTGTSMTTLASDHQAPNTGTITGTVTDHTTGAPIAGATIFIHGPEGPPHRVQTGTAGTFTIDVPPSTYTVLVRAARYESESLEITVRRGETVHRELALKTHTSRKNRGGAGPPANSPTAPAPWTTIMTIRLV